MRKNLFFALLLIMAFSLRISAQSSLLATLNHEGTITTFYGSNALQQAHEAATHGDVITLSSGTFMAVDITKAVTIRGAGMQVDTISHTEPTIIANGFTINVADTLSGKLTMEGLYNNREIRISCLKNAMFLKCRFKSLQNTSTSSIMKDLTFIHCIIANSFYLNSNNGSVSFINSVIRWPTVNSSTTCSFTNCYVTNAGNTNSEYKNCIIVDKNGGSSTSTYFNNLHISNNGTLTTSNNTNIKISPDDERVKYLCAAYNDDNDYKLTEELKSLIKGTDGTEVGIYGGNLPFDPTTTNPQITKFNVAAKSTADGKLSVDIEVNGAQ